MGKVWLTTEDLTMDWELIQEMMSRVETSKKARQSCKASLNIWARERKTKQQEKEIERQPTQNKKTGNKQ